MQSAAGSRERAPPDCVLVGSCMNAAGALTCSGVLVSVEIRHTVTLKVRILTLPSVVT